jgi:membrane associated rhomboid family serine protease
MLPIQDVIPSRTMPWVTLSLIAAGLLALFVELIMPAGTVRAIIFSYGLVPAHPRWPAWPASLLLHAGLLHAGSNLGALWIFGDTVEDRLGHGRYLVLFLGAGAAAALTTMWAAPLSSQPIIGMGGAVAGIIGAYLARLPRSRVLVLVPLPFFFELVEIPAIIIPAFWFLLQVIGTTGVTTVPALMGMTIVWSTIGGGVAGALAVRLLERPERTRVEWWSP